MRASESGRSERHDDGVGLDAPGPQLGDRVLRGLGLLLPRRADERHEGDVQVADVVAADVEAELPDRLEEREDLDVADGAADLGDHDVDLVGGEPADAALDLVGDVRDHLHGLAEVVAAALGVEHRRVDRAGRGVGVAGQALVDEPLVVAEVEVGLAAVVGDEHLAVLEGVHGARVDVDVRVELLHRDPEATGLQEAAQRGCGDPLAERRSDATRDEDVLGHGSRTLPDRRVAAPGVIPRAGRPTPASRRAAAAPPASTPSSRGRAAGRCRRAGRRPTTANHGSRRRHTRASGKPSSKARMTMPVGLGRPRPLRHPVGEGGPARLADARSPQDDVARVVAEGPVEAGAAELVVAGEEVDRAR